MKETLLVLYNQEGKIDIPKGHIKINESPVEGAVRELEEETQIKLQLEPKSLGVINLENDKKFYLFVHKTNTHYEVVLSDEHSSYEYIDLEELHKGEDLRWTTSLQFLNKTIPGDLK